jgi:hypothetical protein
MKKSNLYHVLGLMILFTVILSCNSDEPEDILPNEPEPPVNVEIVEWEKIDVVDRRIINGKVFENEVHLIGTGDFFHDIFNFDQIQSFRPFLTRIGRYMATFNNDLLITRTETDILIFNSRKILEDKALSIKGVDLNENFKSFEDIPLWRGEVVGVNSENVILVPYRTVISGIADNTPSISLIKVKENENDLIIESTIDVDLQRSDVYTTIDRIQSFNNFFLVHIGNSIFRVTSDGLVEEILNSASLAFNYGNNFITIQLNRSIDKIIVKKSDEQGSNWLETNQLPNLPALRTATFCIIDDIVIGFDGLDIFSLDLNNFSELKYLQNNNLEGGTITSILDFNDKVIITTVCNNPSNNCGAFIKDKKDFFLPKP